MRARLVNDAEWDNVDHQLRHSGFAHIERAVAPDEYESLARRQGKILRKEEVGLYLSARYVHRPEAIPFHTDHWDADVLAWRCQTKDPGGGPTYLLDARRILLDNFDDAEVAVLGQVLMDSPWPGSNAISHQSLVRKRNGSTEIFYTPWRLVPILDRQAERLWSRFRDLVEPPNGAVERHPAAVPITLELGHCLFLDNKRMLHGRPKLDPKSRRSLMRLWIGNGT